MRALVVTIVAVIVIHLWDVSYNHGDLTRVAFRFAAELRRFFGF
jgi:hypothetical protein